LYPQGILPGKAIFVSTLPPVFRPSEIRDLEYLHEVSINVNRLAVPMDKAPQEKNGRREKVCKESRPDRLQTWLQVFEVVTVEEEIIVNSIERPTAFRNHIKGQADLAEIDKFAIVSLWCIIAMVSMSQDPD
jgi:hypothetical protein